MARRSVRDGENGRCAAAVKRWLPRRLIPAVALAAAASALPLYAQNFITYIGELGPDYVTIAWGTTSGENTIGRSSAPAGKARVRVGKIEQTVTDHNWVVIRGLEPDTAYDYEVFLANRKIGGARIRTWPAKSEKLRFFVIGDFGTGDSNQARTAQAMVREFERLQGDNPVRFVITTGDNIYGSFGFGLRFRHTGDQDTDWDRKFFRPYGPLLRHIPFYPSLGNHDGNERRFARI